MFIALGLILAIAILGPAVAAYWVVPAEALLTWPALALTFTPTVLVLLTTLVFRAYRPLIEAPLPKSAAEWVRCRLDLSRKVGILVAAVDRGENRGSFYHPASQTIVLADDVHSEHTARAYATAAHELGHAYFHTDRPTWSVIVSFARQRAATLYHIAVGLLVGATLVGVAQAAIGALVAFGLALVLEALVVADEAAATAIAARELGADLPGDQRAIARGHLRRALATYVSTLVAYAVPLVGAPWLLANVGDGVLVGAPPLAGTGATFATVLAVGCVLGGLASLRQVITRKTGFVAALTQLCAIFWPALLAALLCNRPDVPAWTIALAAVPAWSILCAPAAVVIRWLAGFLGRDLEVMPLPLPSTPRGLAITRVSLASLAKKESADGRLASLVANAFIFAAVPLALAWLAA